MDATAMASEPHDFVIVGGGTAGLVIAARLTEDPNISVLVLEAGGDHTDDPMINVLAQHFATFGDPKYDWDYVTVKQPFAGNKRYHWARGKGLGGSSAVNFGMYNQCSHGDLDNWEALGNPGWNWDVMAPYFRKHETFHPPSKEASQRFAADYLDPALRGTDGPIHLSLCEQDINWVQKCWPETAKNAGYPVPCVDPRSGSCIGGFNTLSTVEPETRTRSYAATGYWLPNRTRPNLHVVTNAMVHKITLDDADADLPRATGVTVGISGTLFEVKAKQEIILCAGSIQSPQILELSGIGARNHLDTLGVETVVDNPAVGENLQDHLMILTCFEVKDGISTVETLLRNKDVAAAALEAYETNRSGPLANASSCTGFATLPRLLLPSGQAAAPILSTAASARDSEKAAYTSPSIHEQRDLICKQLQSDRESVVQVIVTPIGVDIDQTHDARKFSGHDLPVDGIVSVSLNITHPFSRGSVHARTSSINDAPVIDPRYLSHPADQEIAGHCVLHSQELIETEPLASFVKDSGTGHKRSAPKFRHASTFAEAKADAPNYCFTTWHPVGTCAMLPREKGGVVDEKCRVHGVKGLRVVDASIFPLIPQGNTMSLVYAVAERIADVVKEDGGIRT